VVYFYPRTGRPGIDPPAGWDQVPGARGCTPQSCAFRDRASDHNKAILDKFRSTGSYLLNFGTIDALEREVVIHRTCARCGAEYEWGVHVVAYGRRLGLSEDQIRSTVLGDAEDPVWSYRQSLLVRLADELFETNRISDGLWTDLEKEWNTEQP
jgi:4-carboxymuconolactone decarboxylase